LGESGPESSAYEFPGGYPSPETVQRAYDDADLNRAVQAYRFLLDLRDGPMVIELPPGPLICVAMDVNQRWVADMGLPAPIRAGVDGMSSCRRATTGTSPRATTPAGRPATGYSAGSGRCRLAATSRRPPSC
jgi:hypothetical protein